ncbi:hypothetical protein [Dyella mobilis]|uniref:Uncharacterized protein n=1 Tax=Dyella mobilis TaxID=1849582 RepID=A0ABS2KD11_9GAMM|nr:hypothetical protein [Dyella mobilis]MBM7129067.1 hypothetical protein [Dyella mobilis]GLQ98361.1 hypothetical protein GCM10007863_27810 [Dyella mobilis]
MYRRSLIFAALALALGCRCSLALASNDENGHPGSGIHDVTDEELSTMRGRFTVGDNTVVWFGVEMISTFQTSNGQTVQGAMTLGMDFSKNPGSPQVTFVPTVTITTRNAPLPDTSGSSPQVSRSVQSGGIANVGGLVQSTQVAGDNNAVANVTRLNIQSGGSAPAASTTGNDTATVSTTSSQPSSASVSISGPMASTSSSTNAIAPENTGGATASNGLASVATTNTGIGIPTGRTATVGDASASSTYSNGDAEVVTSVAGQGSATQWIHTGSLGQTIALTTDNAVVTNQMIVSLVTQQLSSTAQLAHTLTQSLGLSHLNGH